MISKKMKLALELYTKNKSYQAYLRMRGEWSKKGYGMDPVLGKGEYFQLYELARNKGEKNIARSFASADRSFGMRDARKIWKDIVQRREEMGTFLPEYKSVKDIIGIKQRKKLFQQYTDEGIEREEFEGVY